MWGSPGVYLLQIWKVPPNSFWVEVVGIKTQPGPMLWVYRELFLGLAICVYALSTRLTDGPAPVALNAFPQQLPTSRVSKWLVESIKSGPRLAQL